MSSNTGEDEVEVTQVHVEAHIVALAAKCSAESQNTSTIELCLPRGIGVVALRLLPISTSTT